MPGRSAAALRLSCFNADTVVAATTTVGATYLAPSEILAPRIIRVGVSLDF